MEKDKWEYKIITHKIKGIFVRKIDTDEIAKQLGDMGVNGWELISTTSASGEMLWTKYLVFTFKRRIH